MIGNLQMAGEWQASSGVRAYRLGADCARRPYHVLSMWLESHVIRRRWRAA